MLLSSKKPPLDCVVSVGFCGAASIAAGSVIPLLSDQVAHVMLARRQSLLERRLFRSASKIAARLHDVTSGRRLRACLGRAAAFCRRVKRRIVFV